MLEYRSASDSVAEDLFIDLFTDTFGAEEAGYLYSQYPFYDIEARRAAGLKVEKANSIFAKGGYTDKEAERNILSNPFKRFEDMSMMRHTKTIGTVEVDSAVWKRLLPGEREQIMLICEGKLEEYYSRIK